jgi:hypothetical protein
MAQPSTRLLVMVRVLVVHSVLVRWSGMASPGSRRGDLTPKAKHSEEEESNAVRAFAQLRCLGLRFVPVRHSNLVSLVRKARPLDHSQNATGARPVRARRPG